jgi:hypothetical protein
MLFIVLIYAFFKFLRVHDKVILFIFVKLLNLTAETAFYSFVFAQKRASFLRSKTFGTDCVFFYRTSTSKLLIIFGAKITNFITGLIILLKFVELKSID